MKLEHFSTTKKPTWGSDGQAKANSRAVGERREKPIMLRILAGLKVTVKSSDMVVAVDSP